jgi:hypothetical protein
VGSRGLVERRVGVIGVLCEDVVEGHGLQIAASDEVDQLRVAVGDGGQVGVDEEPGLARMLARISLSTSNLDGARVAPNRGIPSRTRPCTSSAWSVFHCVAVSCGLHGLFVPDDATWWRGA